MRRAALAALLVASARAAPVQHHHHKRRAREETVKEQIVSQPEPPQPQSTCVRADNYLNAQYTVQVSVGTPPQELHVVPDTGSFEVVLSSKECSGCGAHRKFDREASDTFASKVPKETVTTSYGQGNVKSEAVYDSVTVGGLTVPRQSILLMQSNELRDYSAAAYDGVMGLGIPSVARKQDPQDLAVQTSLNISTVAICFGQFDQEPGRIDFGPRPNHKGLNFQNVEVVGSSHWAVDVKSIGLTTKPNASAVGEAAKKPKTLAIPGCEDKCTGIIDSGTSLIAMPTTMLNSLLNEIGDVAADCSNVHTLPTLTMSLGGHDFELAPQMYVAKMEVEKTVTTSHAASVLGVTSLGGLRSVNAPDENDPFHSFRRRIHAAVSLSAAGGGGAAVGSSASSSELASYGSYNAPSAAQLKDLHRSHHVASTDSDALRDTTKPETSVACVPLFMEMDMSTDLPGTPLILGIPFLRAYMARFDRVNKTIGLAKVPVGSEYCASCDSPASAMTEEASALLANAGPASTGMLQREPPPAANSEESSSASSSSPSSSKTTTQLNALIPKTDDMIVMGGAIDPPHPGPRPYRWASKAVSLHVNNLRVSQWARDAHYRQWHAYKKAREVAELQEAQLQREAVRREAA